MLDELRERVCEANLQLVAEGLVIETWGNVSGVDRDGGIMVIKPSGVPYDEMVPERMAAVSLDTGEPADDGNRPSSDTPTHLAIYRAFPGVGGIAHTHSLFATTWAQARMDIPCLGTTHADHFYGPVPCTRDLTPAEIANDYEASTGQLIVERFEGIDPGQVPAVLVSKHGPFTWGADAASAVDNAVALEYVARLAAETLRLRANIRDISQFLLDKHFLRKHGTSAYYGPSPATSPADVEGA